MYTQTCAFTSPTPFLCNNCYSSVNKILYYSSVCILQFARISAITAPAITTRIRFCPSFPAVNQISSFLFTFNSPISSSVLSEGGFDKTSYTESIPAELEVCVQPRASKSQLKRSFACLTVHAELIKATWVLYLHAWRLPTHLWLNVFIIRILIHLALRKIVLPIGT